VAVPLSPAQATTPRRDLDLDACFSTPITIDQRFVWKPSVYVLRSITRDLDPKLVRASDDYERGRFDLAGPLSVEIVLSPEFTLRHRGLAARIALESMVVVGSNAVPQRSACWNLLERLVPRLLDELCLPSPATDTDRICAELRVVDVEATMCSECVTGTLSGRDPEASFVTAAAIASRLVREECVLGHGADPHNDDVECVDLILFAATTSMKARSVGTEHAVEMLRILVDRRNGLGDVKTLCERITTGWWLRAVAPKVCPR
jgi:hypothetical protein